VIPSHLLSGGAQRPVDVLVDLACTRATYHLADDGPADGAAIQELLAHLCNGVTFDRASPGDATLNSGFPRISAQFLNALRAAALDLVAAREVVLEAHDFAAMLRELDRVRESCSAADIVPPVYGDFAYHLGNSDSVRALTEIAHDMRSPLTSILFLVDTLRRGQSGPVTPVQERQLGLIYGAALNLNTLACDVIDAGRGGDRLSDGPPVPFSIGDLVMGVCDTVRPISEEKGLPIELELLASDGRIGHPTTICRVLLNLMTNALKYTKRGSVSVRCEELTPDRVLFSVKDTGEGIPPRVMSMLFDGFRPSASGVRFSNAGLGLAICQSFLASMGAELKVVSDGSTGTAFSFELDLPSA